MTAPSLDLRPPVIADGARIQELASRVGELDVNTTYAYVLWCRDFAASSVVAHDRSSGALAGFVTGYRRPSVPTTLVVWQVGVSPDHRRRGVASAMLDHLVGVLRLVGGDAIETTVTPGNAASRGMFASLAARHGAVLREEPLFSTADLGGDHDPEHLLRLEPF